LVRQRSVGFRSGLFSGAFVGGGIHFLQMVTLSIFAVNLLSPFL